MIFLLANKQAEICNIKCFCKLIDLGILDLLGYCKHAIVNDNVYNQVVDLSADLAIDCLKTYKDAEITSEILYDFIDKNLTKHATQYIAKHAPVRSRNGVTFKK